MRVERRRLRRAIELAINERRQVGLALIAGVPGATANRPRVAHAQQQQQPGAAAATRTQVAVESRAQWLKATWHTHTFRTMDDG
jgi:hypothetical protein